MRQENEKKSQTLTCKHLQQRTHLIIYFFFFTGI